MKRLLRSAASVTLAAVLLSTPAVADDAGRYRLAGVMAVGPDYLGILELPGGGQLLVRRGSTLEDGGRVVVIDAARLRIAFPGRPTIEIALDGSGAPAQVPVSLGVLQEQSDNDHIMIRSIDPDAFGEAVKQRPAAGPPAAKARKTGDPALDTALRLAPILNLPPNSRVVSVNEQPVLSAEQAVKTIQQTLDQGMPPRLNLVNAAGEFRVYLKVPET
jgi:hypothetical protein